MTPRPKVDRLSYTVQEAAEAIGISRATIFRLIKAKRLESFSYAGRTLIRADVLQREIDKASGHVPR